MAYYFLASEKKNKLLEVEWCNNDEKQCISVYCIIITLGLINLDTGLGTL